MNKCHQLSMLRSRYLHIMTTLLFCQTCDAGDDYLKICTLFEAVQSKGKTGAVEVLKVEGKKWKLEAQDVRDSSFAPVTQVELVSNGEMIFRTPNGTGYTLLHGKLPELNALLTKKTLREMLELINPKGALHEEVFEKETGLDLYQNGIFLEPPRAAPELRFAYMSGGRLFFFEITMSYSNTKAQTILTDPVESISVRQWISRDYLSTTQNSPSKRN